jgi:biotin carboxyl carrier protein
MGQTERKLLMEFKIKQLEEPITGELISTLVDGKVTIKINQKEYLLKLLRFSSNILEFMLENSYHYAKILDSNTSEVRLLIDGVETRVSKHSKLSEVLERSLAKVFVAAGENNLTSQIPGRVVSVLGKQGDLVSKGDSIVVLESMKMQVAVKCHKDGRIREIRVKQGNTVSRNDVIAVIE